MASTRRTDTSSDVPCLGSEVNRLLAEADLDRDWAVELTELRTQLIPQDRYQGSSSLAAEAATLEADEADRAEMRAVAAMMEALRGPGNLARRGDTMDTIIDIDLPLDLNSIDETGLPWTYLDQARDASLVVPGRHLVVGSGAAMAVAVVVDIGVGGIVHVQPVRGSVESNARLPDDDPPS